MFHWICPECGQEIAPGVRECPVCDPQAASPLPTPIADLKVETPPETQPVVALQVIPLALLAAPAAPQDPVVAPQQPEPRAVPSAPPGEQTFADRLADLAECLQDQRVPYDAQRLTAMPRRETERAPVILDVTSTRLDLAPATMILLAEPQPPSVAAEIPLEQVFDPQPTAHSEASRIRKSQPADPEPSSPSAIQLPGHPASPASPAFGPFQDYYEAANRLMQPVALPGKAAAGAAEPKVTLPGPAIPRELMSLQAAGLVPIQAGRRHNYAANRFGWTGKIAGLAILLTAGIAATYRVLPGIAANPASKADARAVQEQPEAPRPDTSHSLARFVEVTGIRFLEVNKKPQLHYLVVNHSSAPLGSMTVYLTLRMASAKPGQAPLARFTFRSPDLAAYEAKEMASPIERVSGSFNPPDWQELRADVDVQ